MNKDARGATAAGCLPVAYLIGCLFWLPQPGGAIAENASLAPATSPGPWMNASLTPDLRADLLLAQMTQEEQLQLVKGFVGANVKLPYGRPPPDALRPVLPGTAGYVPGIPRLGIPPLVESDAGLGIANNGHIRPDDQATAFPSGLLTASTWDTDIAQAVGAAIGAEASLRGFNVVLGGAMNLAREPRGGRTFEYAGEDPLLAGIITGAQVAGIQSQHVISTVKHFAFNDQETGRLVLSAISGETTARESDLLAFEIASERGNPGSVMCAYNRYNGVYACENDFLLNRILKGDWRYPGWVMSDWGAVHSTVEAANGGLDQESAAGFDHIDYFGAPLQQALGDGIVTSARFHDMLHRILRSMFANGLFDYPAAKQAGGAESHVPIAQHDAEEGIVLLKNTGKLLPLTTSFGRIAVIGSHADVGVLSGGGSSQVIPLGHDRANEFPIGGATQIMSNGAKIPPRGTQIFDPPSPLSEIRMRAPNATVTFDDGEVIGRSTEIARQSDIVVVFASQWMAEGRDVASLSLPGNQDDLILAVAAANPRTVVVLETGGPVTMPWLPFVPAVLEAWYPGSGGAAAIARILFGEINPSGRLAISFPQSETQLPRPVISASTPGMPFEVDYVEGADVGYRWFQRQQTAPLFPFGFGLSYSTFRTSGLEVTANKQGIAISASVKNEGPVAGSQVVQVYGAPPEPAGHGVWRLIGWARVTLNPGETRQVTVAPELRLLSHYDVLSNRWRMPAGSYMIAIGESAALMTSTKRVTLPAREFAP
ncbi:MAG: glycoside hydrolase family 3 C-terminal domain-containing protein [Alphaproteobacteria bacterium]|nr:glycoside hydrolase family 3 C-terminal domain-containing protein [Alphaproteobacteria bacterium]